MVFHTLFGALFFILFFQQRITFFRAASSLMLRTALRLPAGSIVGQPAKMRKINGYASSHRQHGQVNRSRVVCPKPTADTWNPRLDTGPLTLFKTVIIFLSKYDLFLMHILYCCKNLKKAYFHQKGKTSFVH